MLRFPIRSESDAFGWVVAVGLAGLSIGILTELTNSTVGALWGLLLLIWALLAGLRAWRRQRTRERRRVLLVAEGELHPAAVKKSMGEAWRAKPHDVLIVVPSQASGDPLAVQRERQGMEISIQAVKEAGGRPEARLVEGGPRAATAAALRDFGPDEVVIAIRSAGSAWGEHDLEADIEDGTPVSRHPLARR